jgi:hypothetical protein
MLCERKLRLIHRHKDATSVYSQAVTDLTVTRDKISKEEFERLLAFAQKTRTTSEALRHEFLKHSKEHGC